MKSKNRAGRWPQLLSLLLIWVCSSAGAQQRDTLHRRLGEAVVVGNALKSDVVSTAPLYKLTTDKMQTIGVTDIADALHRMPGLNIRDYGGAGGMKTVSVRGLGSTHTGVIYDGIVLSDCQSGQIDLSRYSLDNVDDLSLIIGDNSDIFIPAKAAASAATIVINTGSVPAVDDSLFHATAQLRAGSFGLANVYAKVGKSLTRSMAFSAIAEGIYAENDYPFTLHNGILTTRERRNNSRMRSAHGELNGRLMTGYASSLEVKIYFYDNNRRLPGPVILYNPISDDRLRDRNFFSQLTYLNESLSRFAFRATAKFNLDATYYHEVDGKYADGYRDENYIQREAYVTGSALYSIDSRWSLDYSADYSYNNLTSNDPITVGPWRHTFLQSVAAKMRTSRLLATARLLQSNYINRVKRGESAADRSKLSPSVSLSVRPWGDYQIFLRASYKNIFRMPTFNESYYYRMGSTSLKPENTDQVNIGATWQQSSRGAVSLITLTGDLYYNRVRDKIVAIPMNMFIWTMTNLEKARAFGADVTLDATLTVARRQSLVVTGNYSFQRVQPRTAKSDPDYNKQVAYTPIHSGSASLSWQNPWIDVVVKMTGASDRYGTNSNLPVTRINGYAEFGASLMHEFDFSSASLGLRLDILNIFNTQYEVVAAYPMPGRAFHTTATLKI